MRSFASLALLSALVAPALAKVYIYKPVESSKYAPGDTFTVSWRDDGESPSWTEWGASTIGLYTGSATSQTLLTTLGTVDDAAKSPAQRITIDGGWGPDSSEYFIRVQSVSGVATNGDPLQAFSARFTLTGMTGEWSPEVSAQLAGSSVAAATTAAAGMTTSVRASATAAATAASGSLAAKVVSTGASSSASAPASSASAQNGTSAASLDRTVAGGAVAFAAVALAALA
ncbi:hypothetical protein JCM10207_004476 [Rhodosporidiobolus poonsookiae]